MTKQSGKHLMMPGLIQPNVHQINDIKLAVSLSPRGNKCAKYMYSYAFIESHMMRECRHYASIVS
jgi:hypothetical protein